MCHNNCFVQIYCIFPPFVNIVNEPRMLAELGKNLSYRASMTSVMAKFLLLIEWQSIMMLTSEPLNSQ